MDIQLKQIVQPLLAWYKASARVLPWRQNQQPYNVWVSEIMLQQTRVEAAKPYYTRFLQQLPTIQALANAPEDQLLKLWEGLGYYTRVRNLQKAAQQICTVHGGVFPQTISAIKALPGVGEYTAGAIASICFNLPTPAVDGNVLRVLARLLADNRDIATPALKRDYSTALEQVYPLAACGDFTQSLMELGALICLPSTPKCSLCPLAAQCAALAQGLQSSLPQKAKKPPKKEQQKTVFLLSYKNCTALHRRTEKGVLTGLWQLPNAIGHLTKAQAMAQLQAWGVQPLSLQQGPSKQHVFTHIRWQLQSYIVPCAAPAGEGLVWATPQQLAEDYALPTAFKQFV